VKASICASLWHPDGSGAIGDYPSYQPLAMPLDTVLLLSSSSSSRSRQGPLRHFSLELRVAAVKSTYGVSSQD